ncbi:MAG: cytochrome c [Pseudomonadota bacterium]
MRNAALDRIIPGLLIGLLIALLGLVGASTALAEDAIAFKRHGKTVATLNPKSQFVEEIVEVYEPHEHRTVRYRAVPLHEVLDSSYGPGWRDEEELLFTCADGYQPSIPLATLLSHSPYLAFARADGRPFLIDNHDQGEFEVALGPWYLVWENIEDQAPLMRDSALWPYQVVQLDLIRFEERFARMLPPRAERDEHQAGFLAFRHHCMSCHQVNGQGGGKSRDLNRPNILTLRDEAWLEAYIDDPTRFTPGVPMPAFDRDAPERAATIRRIVAYLGVMAETE